MQKLNSASWKPKLLSSSFCSQYYKCRTAGDKGVFPCQEHIEKCNKKLLFHWKRGRDPWPGSSGPISETRNELCHSSIIRKMEFKKGNDLPSSFMGSLLAGQGFGKLGCIKSWRKVFRNIKELNKESGLYQGALIPALHAQKSWKATNP